MKAFEAVGWSWRHVRIWPATLERFWRLGYLDLKLNTSSYIGYRLNQKGRIRIYGEKPQKSEGQGEVIKRDRD
jgi:holliday junction DNA helicase RuvB